MRILFYLAVFSLLYSCTNRGIKTELISNKTTKKIVVETKVDFALDTDSLVGKKFFVDDVKKASEQLEVYSAIDVLSSFIGTEITFSPEINDSLELVPINGNGLLNTVNKCYGQHRPLVLSPDIIWMTIAQGISTHINENFEKYESTLYKKSKPNTIVIRNDSLDLGHQHWEKLIADFSKASQAYTKEEIYSFMVPKFSTTTQKIHTSYEANLLYTNKKAFTYIGEGGCGIPYITLTGDKEDWVKLKSQLLELDKFDLKYWRLELEPIIDEFIDVFSNKIDKVFWKEIYKEYMNYGQFAITGWIIKFFPYIEVLEYTGFDNEIGDRKMEKIRVKNTFLSGERYLISTLIPSDFPDYKSEVEIIWDDRIKDKKQTMHLYSGIMGAKQYRDGSLKPYVTWAVSSENEKQAEKLRSKSGNLVHRETLWNPIIYSITKEDNKAIYKIKDRSNAEKSIDVFKEELISHLKKSGAKNWKEDTLKLAVLMNGNALITEYSGSLENKKIISSFLNQKKNNWLPAQKLKSETMFDINPAKEAELTPVNSELILIL